jgi:hypothetical protein
MDEQELREWSEQLSEEVARELKSGRSKKWRCPSDLRSRIVSYAQFCRERGEPLGDIAARLGLVESTLARWLRKDKIGNQAGFRSVAIIASEEGETCNRAAASIWMVTPNGYRVEGLDAETLAYILRVVG